MRITKFYLVAVLLVVNLFLLGCPRKRISSEEPTGKIEISKITDINKEVTSRLNVPYMDDDNLFHRLDIYFPQKKKGLFPILVHIHGGGWKTGDKNMMVDTGVFYASKGILFVTPNYRLSPAVMHPAHVEDCAAALAWVFRHSSELGGDKNRIFLSGHSAGAHLAALLGTNPEYLRKYNINPHDLAGVIPVDTAGFNLISEGKGKLLKKFIQGAFGSDESVLKKASPFYNIIKGLSYPKFLVFNTVNRKLAAEEGKNFSDKLEKAGVNVQFIPVYNHTHKEMAIKMYDSFDPVGKSILKFILNE